MAKIKLKKKIKAIFVSILSISVLLSVCIGVKVWATADERENKKSPADMSSTGVDVGAESVLSYFTADEGITLTPNVDTPSYIAECKNGLLVKSSQNITLTYNNIIDVSEMTKEELLLEWQPIPTTLGVADMTQMIIRLEDAEDPRFFVNVSMYRYTYNDAAMDVTTHFLAQPNSVQDFYGWQYGTGMSNSLRHGTMVRSCWVGQKSKDGKTYSNGMKLYYDNAERALYTALASGDTSAYDTDSDGKLVIVDMDDPTHMGATKSKHWTGFPSNRIKISFTATMLEQSTAQYMIYSIDGQSFDGELLKDVTPPKLTVNQCDYVNEDLPIGKVGEWYPFFTAQAVDKISGEVPVEIRVVKAGETFYHTGKGFIPTQAGNYQISYLASDRYGNQATITHNIAVENNISDMQCEIMQTVGALDLTDESLKNANGHYPIKLYYPVKLPEMLVEGGSGSAEVEIIVTCNGNEVDVTDGVFVAKYSGIYVITYLARDYIGNTVGTTYTLEATYSDVPQLNSPILPTTILIDKAVVFPRVDSIYYTVWNQKVKTYDTITVYKEDRTTVIEAFEGNEPVIYTPSSSDGRKVYVEYATAKEKGVTPAKYGQEIILKESNKFCHRFLLGDGMTMTEEDISLSFTAEKEGASVRYIHPLSIFDGLSLEFNVPKESNGYKEVRVTFTDSLNETIKLTVNLYKNPTPNARTSYIAINGDRSKNSEISASFYGNVITKFLFTMNQDGSVNHSDLGFEKPSNDFEGFTSGFVYVDISLHGKEIGGKPATVSLYRLKNQIAGDINEDFIKPIMYIENEPISISSLGARIEIPSAIASDVYDSQVTILVKVTFNGKVIYTAESKLGRLETKNIVAKNYGTYTLSYEAFDESGNTTRRKYSIRVRDNIAPILTIDGDVDGQVKAGDKLKFPNVYASDNVNSDLKIYAIIIDPMNKFKAIMLNEEYVPQTKGRYIMYFYCADSSENQTYSKKYYFTVV